ncbi:uncharacterized protein LOC134842040 isoform X2 [Symsagittifera roscoffensis]|uniref:uncharacterized protein LOC134842040 isoform X2 n=1 Tax=Symsagittifera roscoffensis TaxID=84072 RepID=UPI00307BFB85
MVSPASPLLKVPRSKSLDRIRVDGSSLSVRSVMKDENLTGPQRQLLAIICLTRFLNQIASFWGSIVVPIEASTRNVSAVTVGILTATETAVSWVTSLYISASFSKFGNDNAAERLLVFGIVSHSLSIMAVALTALSDYVMTFVIIFAASYAVSGIGLACSMTSTNALVIAEYENHQITKAKSIETIAYTLGTVLAFVIAGVLYMVGGLAMCVLTVGGLELGWGVVCYFWIPRVLRQLHEELGTSRSIKSVEELQELETLKSPKPNQQWKFLVDLLSSSEIRFLLLSHFFRYMTLAFNQPILSTRLKSFDLSFPTIGGIVALAYIAIAVMAVPWKVMGTTPLRRKVILLGSLVLFSPVPAFMGPIKPIQNILGIEPNAWLLAATLSMAGIFLSPGLVLDQLAVTEEAEKAKIITKTRDLSTSGAIGGILTSFEFLGLFIGPPVGGAFRDYFGSFEDGIFYGGFLVIAFSFSWLLSTTVRWALEKKNYRRNLSNLDEFPDTKV